MGLTLREGNSEYFYKDRRENNMEADYRKMFKCMSILENKKEQLSLFD